MNQTIRCFCLAVAAVLAALAMAPVANALPVNMAWTPIGNPGNAPDRDPGNGKFYGGVDYSYNIGTYDVTTSQYVAFLNSNDPTGTNKLGLYNDSMPSTLCGITYTASAASGSKYSVSAANANHPVNYVTWYSAARFANWLDNDQVPGSTESGAYTLTGGTPLPKNWPSITRSVGATVFIPSESEWYKAAYYNPNTGTYSQYPSGSVPNASAPTSAPNSANYNNVMSGVTDVGAYTGSKSAYGAYDMAGNVFQWNEETISFGSFYRGLRGGAYYSDSSIISSLHRSDSDPRNTSPGLGFRVASLAIIEVPEPSTAVLAGLAGTLMWFLRKRFK